MHRIISLVSLFILSVTVTFSQGVELYSGYPVSIKRGSDSQKVSNLNNGQAGLNLTAYIRSVAIQVGVGYISNNYTVYGHGSNGIGYQGTVFHQFLTVPVMVYPRLITDGKNTLSIGVGGRTKFPVGKMRRSVVYDNGEEAKIFKGRYKGVILPRAALRYTRLFGGSFLCFAEVFTEFNVMPTVDYGGMYGHIPPGYQAPTTIPTYKSLVTLGANAGIGYLIPIDGVKVPRYFQKRQKKQAQ